MVRYRNDLQRELEALKRRAEGTFGRGRKSGVAHGLPSGGGTQVVPGRVDDTPAGASDRAKSRSGTLAELVPGEEIRFEGAAFYRVLADAGAIWEDAGQFHAEYLETLESPFVPEAKGLESLLVLKEVRPEEICYLDLETTGLSGVPLFLIGLLYTEGERLIVDQLFARDYTEEPAVLGFINNLIATYRVIVTFNGIHFDIPFVADRMRYSGMEFSPPDRHVDLLPLARRMVRGRTPNHKLQTLEVYLLRRKRIGDVPGREIPDVYHEFVRTGDAGGIAGIVHHNRLDLLTMLQLVTVFLAGGS